MDLDRLYQRAEQKAREHLTACLESLFEDGEEMTCPPAAAPFCGCETCVVREVLMAARAELFEIVQLESQLAL